MAMFVCGDTHGNYDIRKLDPDRFNYSNLTKDDYVLICGDFGGVWNGGAFDATIQEWYNRRPWTTLFVDGNHENHDLLDAYKVIEWNGGRAHQISDSIYHLMRGEVYQIDGHKIFTMGGAESIDKILRTEGVSWWTRELPSFYEYANALDNLHKNNNEVDYIFTHCCSTQTMKMIDVRFKSDKLTDFFNLIEEQAVFKHWYFGHYHVDKKINDSHTALYDSVIKLW